MGVRESVLEALERRRGEFISGEALAKETGVSRQAVNKAVERLKAEGYTVVCAPRKGYALDSGCDLLSPSYLSSGTGVKVIFYESVTSTNSVAAAEYLKGGECLVVSLAQTAGKKRDGGLFLSPENGGIYLSYAFPFAVSTDRLDALREACSGAVLRVLSGVREGIEARDTDEFYYGGRKAAGMLVECGVNATLKRTEYAVVGVGIYTGDGSLLTEELAAIPSEEPRNRIIVGLTNAIKEELKKV